MTTEIVGIQPVSRIGSLAGELRWARATETAATAPARHNKPAA
jgi:hypothetical protein